MWRKTMGGQVPSIQGVTNKGKGHAQVERAHACKENFNKKKEISTQKQERDTDMGRDEVECTHREWSKAVRAFIHKNSPLALLILPDHKLPTQELERGGHSGVQILNQGNWVPVVSPHKRIPTRFLFVLPLFPTIRSQHRLHAQAGLGFAALGCVWLHGRPGWRHGRHHGTHLLFRLQPMLPPSRL